MDWRNKSLHIVAAALVLVVLVLGSGLLLPEQAAHAQARAVHAEPDRSQSSSTRFDETGRRFSREQWELTEEEWTRYLELLHGPRGSISPSTVSPIEVLGVHARSEEERMKYARKWAKIMHEDAERVLRFQHAYTLAMQELYGQEDIIDMAAFGQNYSPVDEKSVQAGDRVLLFLKLRDCRDCQALYTRVRRAAFEADAQLDLYFTDTQPGNDDNALMTWIAEQRFDEDRLKRNKVTFNHDRGGVALQKANGGEASSVPSAFRIRNDLIDPLRIGMPGL